MNNFNQSEAPFEDSIVLLMLRIHVRLLQDMFRLA